MNFVIHFRKRSHEEQSPHNPGSAPSLPVSPHNPGSAPSLPVSPHNPGSAPSLTVSPHNPGSAPQSTSSHTTRDNDSDRHDIDYVPCEQESEEEEVEKAV